MFMDLIPLLGGTLVGGLLKLWGMKQESQKIRDEALYRMAGLKTKDRQDARAWDGKYVQWTRRAIALMAVGSIIVLPKVAAIFTDLTVIYGTVEWNSGFLFFTEGKDVVKWTTMKGLVITPLDVQVVLSIIGLYFGGSLVGHGGGRG